MYCYLDYTDVGDLRRAICQAHLYTTTTTTATTTGTATATSGASNNSGPSASSSSGTGVSSGASPSPGLWSTVLGPPVPQRLTLLDCYPPGGLIRSVLDDRESVLQVGDGDLM